jgi:hypothetical protein
MKQSAFRLTITILVIVALIQSGAVNALFMLFLAGTVPGTEYVIPANIMMLGYSTLMSIVIFYSFGRSILRAILDRHLHNFEDTSAHSPAKRRFKLI